MKQNYSMAAVSHATSGRMSGCGCQAVGPSVFHQVHLSHLMSPCMGWAKKCACKIVGEERNKQKPTINIMSVIDMTAYGRAHPSINDLCIFPCGGSAS